MRKKAQASIFAAVLFSSCFLTGTLNAQHLSNLDRGRAEDMLRTAFNDVRKNYYDPSFHDVDLKALADEAKQRIEGADSFNMAMAHIAQALMGLNDSHTYLIPPPRPYILHYGFEYQMIGNRCFVVRVRPESDAEQKGLKPGDELLGLDGYPPSRADLWKMKYRYNTLRPEPGLELVIRTPQGQQRKIEAKAKMQQQQRVKNLTSNDVWDVVRQAEAEEHMGRVRETTVGDEVTILKIPGFTFDESALNGMINDARKRPGLIVDLRQDHGGSVEMLKQLVGGVFDKEVKIADRVGRKQSKPEVAKSWGSRAYSGKLIVLVDSESASAAELFARVIQLEKRGVVMGDQTAGAVMEARYYDEHLGMDTIIPFGVMVTVDNLIMTDGKSLEHAGVTPDLVALPTATDMAAGRDPVLSKAVESLGGKLSPESAGKLFPYEWPKY